MITLKRRRGAAEHDGALVDLRAHDGDIARVITRRLFLFVGVFVFFIDNDQAEILERRENGAARPNHDPRAARIYLLPFIMTFTFGQVAV